MWSPELDRGRTARHKTSDRGTLKVMLGQHRELDSKAVKGIGHEMTVQAKAWACVEREPKQQS